MTALEKYVRLEAIGQWREAPGAPAREVVASFGDATLLLADLADRPLGHWALAGVQAIGTEGGATLFAMSRDGTETLAIRDADMIEAIAAVSRAHRHAGAPGAAMRRRRRLPALLALAALAAALAFAPGLIRAQAARMVPPETAEAFGDEMLLQLMATQGPLCADPAGRRALAQVAGRVAHGETARLRALDLGPAPLAVLPGPTIVLGRATLDRAEDPAEIAGWIGLALAREQMRPGPERLMAAAGPVASLRYIFTGRLSDAALARAAAAALAPPTAEDVAAAYGRLRDAGLATAPFADGLRRAGLAALPGAPDGAPALDAGDWAALKGLCRVP